MAVRLSVSNYLLYICQYTEQLSLVFINMFGLTLRTVAAKSLGSIEQRSYEAQW